MTRDTRPGTVIFTGDKDRLARFYHALTGLAVRVSDDNITVLASDEFELVIHALPGEPRGSASQPRNGAYIKSFFPVTSLADARMRAAAFEGQLSPASEEWEARGSRACEAIDPDGNHIQCRRLRLHRPGTADGRHRGRQLFGEAPADHRSRHDVSHSLPS